MFFVLGVVAAKYVTLPDYWLVVALIPLIGWRRGRLLILVSVCLFAFWAGNFRMHLSVNKERPIKNLIGQKVTLAGQVGEDGYYDSKKRTSFIFQTSRILEPVDLKIDAPIRVGAFGLASADRGDQMILSGKLTAGGGNVAAAMYYAKVVDQKYGQSWLDDTRRSFTSGLNSALPEPEGPFAAGLLIGQRTSIPDNWQQILQNAGLSHIVAVSGYNLTILVRFIRRIFRKRSRYQILLFSFLLVGAFMSVTGNSPSIMRAAIVVALMQIAWFYGRNIKPMVVIGLAAVISALIDPYLVVRSVSWYLSFAAFFGVLIIAPLAHRSSKKRVGALLGLISESLAAELMTLPIIAMTFGRISLVGIIANVLVVPLVPLAMALCLTSGLAGWLVPGVAGWLALPTHVLLKAMLKISQLVATMPGSQILINVDIRAALVIYAVLVVLVLLRIRKRGYGSSLNIENMLR